MDVYSNNRAFLNTRRVERVAPKVIVFNFPSKALSGSESHDIRFKFPGKVIDAYASCKVAGSGDTKVIIDRCSEADYQVKPVWENIFSKPVIIPSTKHSSLLADEKYELTPTGKITNSGDHYKATVEHNGTVEGITVELTIMLDTEE